MENTKIDESEKTDIPPEPVKKTIAIVQLLRLGDIIQTVQMAKGLRDIHGDKYKLVLVARKRFANHLKEIINEVFDECLTVDLNDLTKTDSKINLKDTLKNIKDLTNKVSSHNIEVLINLSYSKTASYLMSLINANHKIGPFYDDKANLIIKDKWSQYLYANVLETNQNPYNLVDLFNLIVGVDVDKSKKSKVNHSIKKKVFIHPFASDDKKRWVESKWVEVIFKFLKDNTDKEVFIVGSNEDKDNSSKITDSPLLKSFSDRVTSLCGKYSINDLQDKFDNDSMFIGHDSMVSHLAALKSIPIITISIGPVRPYETTPYVEGVYNLSPQTKCFPCKPDTKCDFYQCHADIPYQVVNEVLNQVSNGKEVSGENLKETLSHFHLNSTNIRVSSFDKSGILNLSSVIDDLTSYTDVNMSFYKLAWAYLFNGIEVHQDLPKISDNTHKQLANDMKGLQQFFEVCEFGKKYSRYILEEISSDTPDIQKIKDYSAKVDEVDNLSDMIAQTFSQILPITNYSKLSKSNLHGENLVELTESSFYAFHDLSSVASIIYDLCEKTLTNKQKEKTKISAINAR